MKKLYNASKTLNLDNILSEDVFSDDVVPDKPEHVCNCDKNCDGDCSCYNKTFENLRE